MNLTITTAGLPGKVKVIKENMILKTTYHRINTIKFLI